MGSTPIVGLVATGGARIDNCLTCGIRTPLPITAHFVRRAGKPPRRMGETVGPHCNACRGKHARGRLPINPYWYRTPDDAPARS